MRLKFIIACFLFASLLGLALVCGSLPVQPSGNETYCWVEAEIVVDNPTLYAGQNISTGVTIVSSEVAGDGFLYETEEGLILLYSENLSGLGESDVVIIRGIDRSLTDGYFVVREHYVLDTSSSTLRSIPGIGIFLLLIFGLYRFDLSVIAFVPRGANDA